MVDVLLSGLGSGVVDVTDAVFVIVPCACGLMVPRMIIVRDAPAAMVPRFRLPVHGLKVVPLSVEYCASVILDGILSVSMTFSEEEGPAFATVRV